MREGNICRNFWQRDLTDQPRSTQTLQKGRSNPVIGGGRFTLRRGDEVSEPRSQPT